MVRTFSSMNICKNERIYCVKKDVQIIFQNEPLLFVHGPPVFIRVAITEEESTSVFILNEEESRYLVKQSEKKSEVRMK